LSLTVDDYRATVHDTDYAARSYNRAKQVIGLIDHLFVRYPVPLFLYRTMLSWEGLELVFGIPALSSPNLGNLPPEAAFRHWFLAVARGESFAKVAKDVFTRKEAHWFLQAPNSNTTVQNVFWAWCAAAGLPKTACDFLLERLDPITLTHIGARMPDVLRFFVEAWPQMRGYDRDEIIDFVRAAVLDHTFSFKGRTYGSMRKLCHEWHRGIFSGQVREYRSWAPALPAWCTRLKAVGVRADELTSNRALAQEGRVQKHCVYTYTSLCLQGRSTIVSLRWFAYGHETELLDRLTIEVSVAHREIVQIRGKLNRCASEEEMKVVRLWASEVGLKIDPYAN
jgi:hypothetical protein